MIRIVVATLCLALLLGVVRALPGGQIPGMVFGYLLVAWVLYRAYPALRDDIGRLAGRLPGRRLRRSKPLDGGF
jgi:hypothetical protein